VTSGKKLYGIEDQEREGPTEFEAVAEYHPGMFLAAVVIGLLMIAGGAACEVKAGRDLRQGAAAVEATLGKNSGKIAKQGAFAPYLVIFGGAACIFGALRYRRRKDT